jgi:hypothetical protein
MELKKYTEAIFTIDNFLTGKECDALIVKSEKIGYEEAKVTTDRGEKVLKEYRNNNRVLHTDFELAEKLWNALKSFVPSQLGNSQAVGLNELFRFYKYESGQQFKKHRDQSFIRNENEASYFTFMIYLNDDFEGGETTFNNLAIKPQQGTALIFLHDLEHEGSEIKTNKKYVLRTDIMYRLREATI